MIREISKMFPCIIYQTSNWRFVTLLLFHFLGRFWLLVFEIYPTALSKHRIAHIRHAQKKKSATKTVTRKKSDAL